MSPSAMLYAQMLNITHITPQVITSDFERRGWQEVQEEGDESWNIYWANVGTVRQVFSSDSLQQLRPDQLINHFPNHYELTRKVIACPACSCILACSGCGASAAYFTVHWNHIYAEGPVEHTAACWC
jgi:hypothetical protein